MIYTTNNKFKFRSPDTNWDDIPQRSYRVYGNGDIDEEHAEVRFSYGRDFYVKKKFTLRSPFGDDIAFMVFNDGYVYYKDNQVDYWYVNGSYGIFYFL